MSQRAVRLRSPTILPRRQLRMAQSSGTQSAVFFSRAPRSSFGVICAVPYVPWIRDHHGRSSFVAPSGQRLIPGSWSQIVKKGVVVDSEAVCRETYTDFFETANPDLKSFSTTLTAYSGDDKPIWACDPSGRTHSKFRTVCTLSADLRGLEGALERKTGEEGSAYWSLKCDVCIRFGGTELEAYLEWKENGITRTGPVFIIPEDSIGV